MAFENVPMVQLPESSHVSEAGYDPVGRFIVVRYRRGGGGIYHGASQEEFEALIASDHPGSYIHSTLKGKYGYEAI